MQFKYQKSQVIIVKISNVIIGPETNHILLIFLNHSTIENVFYMVIYIHCDPQVLGLIQIPIRIRGSHSCRFV